MATFVSLSAAVADGIPCVGSESQVPWLCCVGASFEFHVPPFDSDPASHMFGTPNYLTSNFIPIYAAIELLSNEPTYCDVVSSHQIKSMADLRAWFGIVSRANNSFDRLAEHNVRDLVAGEQSPD